MPSLEGYLYLIGALGLFLYAISRLGDGVQKMAGEKIRHVLERQARGPLSSITTGISIAAALQSNFLTFGMISSLVNAGLLGLLPALWTMMGVNLGMTITAQLMAINIGAASFLMLGAGYVLYFYAKKRRWHYFGQIIFNLGLMYLGFSIFHQAFQLLSLGSGTVRIITGLFLNPWTGFMLGMAMAALLRSSNTMVVMIQGIVGMELVLSGPQFLGGAIALIIGSNIGTSFINILIGLDRVPTVKKANWLHFSFNLTTGLLWLVFLPFAVPAVSKICYQTAALFQWFQTSVFRITIPFNPDSSLWFHVWQLATVHTLFNLTVILVWFPLIFIALKLGLPLFGEKGKVGSNGSTYLDRRALQSPALALILALHEINQMATISQEMLKSARLAFVKGQVHLINTIDRDEEIVDDLQEQITFYLSALLSQNSLTEVQSQRLAGLLHIVSDVERVGDHAHNIANLAEKKYKEQLPFSEIAINEIELFFGKSIDLYNKACVVLKENNLEIAKQILNREENIDKLEEELRQNHIHRLNQGKCWPGSGVIYVEMLSNLERVAAHSANIAAAALEEGEV